MKHRTGISHAEPHLLSQTKDCGAKLSHLDDLVLLFLIHEHKSFVTPVKWQTQYSIRHHNNKCCNMPLTSSTCKTDFEYLKGTTQW